MARTFLGEVTVGAGMNYFVPSGYLTTGVTIEAHPSNSGPLYIRASDTTGFGYPLAAGASLRLTNADLRDYTVSGVIGARIAWAADR